MGHTGDRSRTVIEHWDGTGWAVVASPSPGSGYSVLSAVTAASASDVWDGSGWNIVPSPNPGLSFNDLQGVAALSATDVWAVGTLANGHYNDPYRPAPPRTLTEHWNGRSWKVVASPNPSTTGDRLNGAAALAPGQLWAAGLAQTASGTRTLMLHSTQG